MSADIQLLEKIEAAIVDHGGDLSGWTKLDEDRLQIFDGRASLTARVDISQIATGATAAHCHVFVTIEDFEEEPLDCCVIGTGSSDDEALQMATALWVMCIAGPIRSFMDHRPLCMTCRAGAKDGDESAGFVEGTYGLDGVEAYVGPAVARGAPLDEGILPRMDDDHPWFRYALESAAPRRLHLAKVTLAYDANDGWSRQLEIDGHDVSHVDPDWPSSPKVSGPGYVVRYAVFAFPEGSDVVEHRRELERTILEFARRLPAAEDVDALEDAMVNEGFDPNLVHEAESLSTIAFGRLLFESHGWDFPPTIIRARANGRVEETPLMSLPAYNRARALGAVLDREMSEKDFQSMCLYSAESNAILNAMDQGAQPQHLTMFPCVVPDREADDATMDAARAALQTLLDESKKPRKPWWKFW